jgi:hypothetical protein
MYEKHVRRRLLKNSNQLILSVAQQTYEAGSHQDPYVHDCNRPHPSNFEPYSFVLTTRHFLLSSSGKNIKALKKINLS